MPFGGCVGLEVGKPALTLMASSKMVPREDDASAMRRAQPADSSSASGAADARSHHRPAALENQHRNGAENQPGVEVNLVHAQQIAVFEHDSFEHAQYGCPRPTPLHVTEAPGPLPENRSQFWAIVLP
jgi:hypothetical protein